MRTCVFNSCSLYAFAAQKSLLSCSSLLPSGLVFVNMAPKELQKFNLDKWAPTEAELQEAKALLQAQDPKKKRSSMASMVAFVGKGDPECANKVAELRGEARQDYCARYLAYMTKKKAGTLTTTSSHSTQSVRNTDYFFWSRFEMEKEVGSSKADHWISSGQLTVVGDRITGSLDPELCEYKVCA